MITVDNVGFVFVDNAQPQSTIDQSGCLPVSAGPLGRELHAIHRVVAVVIHDLGQAEVCDLDLSAGGSVHQQDVTWITQRLFRVQSLLTVAYS